MMNTMQLHTGISKAIGAAWLCVSLIASAQDLQLSLKHGVYVSDASACKGAPNAEILFWDGIGFSGAHSSKCRSRVLGQDGARFQISTTCSALGDGSENPTARDTIDSFSLVRLSSTRFELVKADQHKSSYRWCSLKDVD